jgi:hypothetical protein
VTLVIAVLGVQAGVLTQTGYALGVVTVLATALVTPPTLKSLIGVLPAVALRVGPAESLEASG